MEEALSMFSNAHSVKPSHHVRGMIEFFSRFEQMLSYTCC